MGIFDQGFPYSNFHDLNLDWIIKIAKDFLDQYTHIQDVITEGEQALQDKAEELENTLQEWYDTHSEELAEQLASILEELNEWYETHQYDLNQALSEALTAFNNGATAKAQEVIETIPADYTELANTVEEISDELIRRTTNLLNYREYSILNGYVNQSTRQFNENSSCRFIYLDVTAYRGQQLNLFSYYETKLQLSTFTTEPTLETPTYAERTIEQNSGGQIIDRTLSITIGNSEVYLGIWYWYNNTNDDQLVLKNLYLYTGSTIALEGLPYYLGNITRDGFNPTDYSISPYAFSDFPTDNSANEKLYLSKFPYKKGYVKQISSYMSASGTITVLLISTINGAVLRRYTKSGTGLVNIDVYDYIGVPFYLALGGVGACYISSTFGSTDLNYLILTDSDYAVGDYVDLTFPTRNTSEATYIITQKVTYSSVQEEIYQTKPVMNLNKFFVAGDSITAGHNQYTVGEHWWEAVSRTYGYIPSPAARTGAGFSYWNGTNGCKIARDSSFDDVGVAVFAFGTNDYGNNIPIGTINDTYTVTQDSSQTFYACVKYVIETVLDKNPFCTLILSLPINRSREGSSSTEYAYGYANSAGHTLLDYCDAIIACCNKYRINYIDNRQGSFNNLSLPYMFYDGLHPTDMGYKKLGQDMTGKLGALVRPYSEYDGINGYGQF